MRTQTQINPDTRNIINNLSNEKNEMSMTLQQAESALATANAEYDEEMRQDLTRSDGSGAQERRRDEYKQRLLDRIYSCKQDLDKARRLEAATWITDSAFVAEVGKSYELAFGEIVYKGGKGLWTAKVRIVGTGTNDWIDIDTNQQLDPALAQHVVKSYRPL